MTAKRVILVGDQQNSESILQMMAANKQDEWHSVIVGNGEEALNAMKNQNFDAIVSKAVLPGMDCIQLLKEIKERYPGTVRFILSDQSNKETMVESMGYIHQCISETCDAESFRKILNNSLGLRNLLSNKDLHAKIASVGSLPSLPETYEKLVAELQSESTSIRKVADLVKRDLSISTKLLQMVNSAYFGISTRVQEPLQAVNLLGLDTVKSMVLTAGVFDKFKDPKLPGFSIENIYSHSVAVGGKAKLIAKTIGLVPRQCEDSLMGGMLHDVGKLLMLTHFQDELIEANRMAQDKSILLYQAQKEIMGVGDAEIGAHLLSLWGLSDSILEIVARHYLPHHTPDPTINSLTAVHIAYAFDFDQANNLRDKDDSVLDMEYLSKLNLTDKLDNLRYFCNAASYD